MARIFNFKSSDGNQVLTDTLIKRDFLNWMQTKSPEFLDHFALDLAGKWVTERNLRADVQTLYALDELLADIKWEYIKGVCHEQ
jgi:hypothetical protein